MRLITALTQLCAVLASATTVSYDTGYDDPNRSMTAVACSDGVNGLITKYGWQTQGAIPGFRNIGGSSTIAGWNSDQCGQCFSVSWNGRSVNILAIDSAKDGLNLSEAAMNSLTGGQAVALGRVDAVVTKVGVDMCGLTPRRRAVEFMA